MSKHICVLHGYLLSGSGSNVYTYNLAKQWKTQGNAVTIICQDPNAGSYIWVDEFYGPKDAIPPEPPKPATCRVIVPDIDGLPMVYNYDEYEGYSVKTIPHCTEEEIEAHITMTARAVRAVANQGSCYKFLTNHALFSPVIASRGLKGTSIPYDIKIHGSALNVVIRPHPEFKKYAIEGLKGCNKIIAGTHHIYRQVKEIFAAEESDLNLADKLVIVPPGMDPNIFELSSDSFDNIRASFLQKIKTHIAQEPKTGRISDKFGLAAISEGILHTTSDIEQYLVDLGNTYNQRVVEFDLPNRFPVIKEDEPVIIFIGKFINFKGLAELILCFPKIVAENPKVHLVLVGYGIVREHMEMMLYALKTGNVALFEAVGKCKDENGKSFLESSANVDDYFRQLTEEELARITITGFLSHEELGLLLHLAAVSVVATKTGEAFGMVSVEAMAAGVLPLCVYHTGIVDVLDEVKSHDVELEKIMHIDVTSGGDFGACDGVELMKVFPGKLNKALEFLYPEKDGVTSCRPTNKRRQVAEELRNIAKKAWSWEGICNRLLAL